MTTAHVMALVGSLFALGCGSEPLHFKKLRGTLEIPEGAGHDDVRIGLFAPTAGLISLEPESFSRVFSSPYEGLVVSEPLVFGDVDKDLSWSIDLSGALAAPDIDEAGYHVLIGWHDVDGDEALTVDSSPSVGGSGLGEPAAAPVKTLEDDFSDGMQPAALKQLVYDGDGRWTGVAFGEYELSGGEGHSAGIDLQRGDRRGWTIELR